MDEIWPMLYAAPQFQMFPFNCKMRLEYYFH